MTEEEYKKFKQPTPPQFLIVFKEDVRRDKYGVYSTGIFKYKGKTIIINNEDGVWHLSVSANHTLGYYEIKDIRYKFMPDDMGVAQIFPPRNQFVNLHENCFHLWELTKEEMAKIK